MGGVGGFDLVRGSEIGNKNIQLTHLEEAFTSEHWMVRIYKVKRDAIQPQLLRETGEEVREGGIRR